MALDVTCTVTKSTRGEEIVGPAHPAAHLKALSMKTEHPRIVINMPILVHHMLLARVHRGETSPPMWDGGVPGMFADCAKQRRVK
jgi:hypothetical protein